MMIVGTISCNRKNSSKVSAQNKITNEKPQLKSIKKISTGAQQTQLYIPLLKHKNIAIVANQTSVIFKAKSLNTNVKSNYTHLVDSLLSLKITIEKVFAPEHGFRGTADAGALIADGFDTKTKLPIISLHGKNKKPTDRQLNGIDVVLFDIQDVGVRFYTYISTLHYVMEACAENNVPLIVLDRPNPNGFYVDGPTLNLKYKSFIGLHPVPLVYGMTIGEYATMINGEHWLKNKITCNLTVIALKNYTHQSSYSLPIRPSPNLPNDKAINLYPSLGFFEGTTINAGRGTEHQFQQYGAPFFPKNKFSYVPKPNFGSKHPKYEGKLCYGVDLKNAPIQKRINLNWLLDAYKKTPKNKRFFVATFNKHAGNKILKKQLKKGISINEIYNSWQPKIEEFKKIRKKYLIYR